ncbi:hypothetical protein K432DRAFT_324652, partial [Lepidopterella palustris CBS 459.81]
MWDDPECDRCDRSFGSQRALQQHIDDSSRHHICKICNYDADGRSDLLEHWRDVGCVKVCQGCLMGFLDWSWHCRVDHVCPTCHCHQENENNLAQHMLVHLPRDLECWGCYRMFSTLPGMIIHLESGSCLSNINKADLNESAAMLYQWNKIIQSQQWRDRLLSRDDLDSYDSPQPFRCPGCGATFRLLSGLFQHVGSPACDQELEKGAMKKLVRWLKNRYE